MNKKDLILREYQEEAINVGAEYFSRKNKQKPVIFVEPVAAGKSLIIGSIAQKVEQPTLVLQPSVELLTQNYEKLLWFGGKATIYSASAGIKEISDTTYATLGSIKKIAKKFKEMGVENVIIDECLAYDTYISLQNSKPKQIGNLYNKYSKGDFIPKVKTINEDNGKIEYKNIKKVMFNGIKDIYKAKFNSKVTVKCTLEHRFLTIDKGWVKLKDLKLGDKIMTSITESKIGSSYVLYPNKTQIQIMYGSHIGDGHIAYSNDTQCRLKLTQGVKQLNYLKFKNNLLWNNEVKTLKNGGYGDIINTVVTKQIYYPYSIEDAIDNINLIGIAIIWGDDGHLCENQNCGTLYSFSTKPDLQLRLLNKINDIVGIKAKILNYKRKSNNKTFSYIKFSKADVEILSSKISKYLCKNIEYKIVDKYKDSINTFEYSNLPKYHIAVFKGKEFYKKDKVYDLTINDNHNYTICNKNTTDGIIVHNCHYGYSPKTGSMFRNFMKELNPKRVLGFTATPIRLNTYGTIERTYSQLDFLMKGRKGAPAYFKDIIHLTQIEEMVTNKFWAKLSYEQYDFDESVLTLNTTGAEYTEHSISEAIEKNGVNNNIYLRLKSLLKNGAKNILVFVDSIETAMKFESLFDSCKAVTGSMNKKDRKKIIEDFKNGDLKIVVNFGTLTTGFDHPWLDTVILGRPTQSFALYYQIVGRVTRNPLYPKQKDALVIDFCNNVKRFGKLEDVNFEYIENYGWGMFSNENLLSTHPMDLPIKTKEDINQEILDSYKDSSDIKVWFGKYKGKRLSEVPVYWSEWAFKNMDFKGKKMLQLKNQIVGILIKNGKLTKIQ